MSTVAVLAAKTREGAHAILATRLLSLAATVASIAILARLIRPEDFGVWAIAGLALGLMTIVREFGLTGAIVQARALTPHERDGYFWASVAVSLAAAALLALAAPLLARLYGAPLVRPVIWVGCASLVIGGLGFVHAALLRRGLEYDKLVVMEGGGMLCGLATGIGAAFLWRDVWALVAGHIASATWMSAAALLLHRWRPGPPSRKRGRIDLSFSLQVMSYNLLTFAGNNVGMVAGYRFAAAELGLLNRAQTLQLWGQFALLTPLTEAGFALLCRLKPDATYRDAYVSLARRVWVLFIPLAAVLPIVAGDFILAFLGPAWAPAAPLLAWFALAVFGQAFASLFAQLMTSQGRGGELRRWAVADLLLRAGGAVAGSQLGIVGLAAGFSLASFFGTVPLLLWIAGRSGPVQWRDQLGAMRPGLLLGAAACTGAAAALLGADAFALGAGSPRLLFVGGSAALAWSLACLALQPGPDTLLGRSFP